MHRLFEHDLGYQLHAHGVANQCISRIAGFRVMRNVVGFSGDVDVKSQVFR